MWIQKTSRAIVAASFVMLMGDRADAQTPPPGAPVPAATAAPSAPVFLGRFDFHISTVALGQSDPRFTWDTHIGGDVDLVDYHAGRLTFLADYEAVLGSELRPFDPNQGTYTLESFATYRARFGEVGGGFHHVSRHLGDRPKLFAIAWNEVGVRLNRQLPAGRSTVDIEGNVSKVIQHGFVDYAWTAGLDLALRRPVSNRLAVFARGSAQLIGVNPDKAGRGTQNGGRVEAGVRLSGRAAALELFAGFERRIDAYPLERTALQWFMGGFRLVKR